MTYRKSTKLPVSPEEAFALITEPERLRRWQTVSAQVDLRAGGEYRWTVLPGNVAAGTFREVEPGRRVVFGWGWDGSTDLPPDASTVTVTVEPDAGGSLVTLTHDGLDELQAKQHAEGWDHFLERLETLARTGDAGPDSWGWEPERLDPLVAAEAVLAAVQPVLRNVTDAHAARQTPCADFSCHDVAEHLVASIGQLAEMAGVTVLAPHGDSLEDRVSVTADQAISGWRARGLDGTVPGPGGSPMPAAFAASILPVEILLHGWDLAQATGQPLVVSDHVVGYVRTLAEGLVPGGRGTAFGDELAPPSGAGALDRLAAFAGRTPIVATT
jgi:uncharacterized protein (TIGR03086 family)